jgi:hypothetical protein
MGKENENIHIHIIEEDYKRSKQKQNEHDDTLGKAELPDQIMRNNASVVKQLQKMHTDFAVVTDPTWLRTNEENPKENQSDEVNELNDLHISELFSAFQKMKAEEQELLCQKQNFLETEQELRNVLIQEICKKKKTIQELKTEISSLQNTCKEISQALGIPYNI